MNRKFVLLVIWISVLIGMVPAVVSAEVSVGVKEGEWMEYKVTYTGNPPEEHQTWIKIEIFNVQGTSVTLNAVMKFSDGTQETVNVTADLETGGVETMVIPANLKKGDVFYDKYVGDITISGVEERTYAGARRIVVFATVLGNVTTTLHWDKTTGVLVEVSQSRDNYTMKIKVDKTNVWEAKPFELLDPTVFYILIILIILIMAATVATIALFVTRRRKRPPEERVPPPPPQQT